MARCAGGPESPSGRRRAVRVPSPLSKGALLADEVGLGKTIEAGLVLSQKWAERKRRILVITPSNLRKQWYQELTEKFFLPCRILESKSYNAAIKQGHFRPFEARTIVICSYQFARSKAADVQHRAVGPGGDRRSPPPPQRLQAHERHRQHAQAGACRQAQAAADRHAAAELAAGTFRPGQLHRRARFGDLKSFREQFANLNQEQVFQTLKARLKPICHRTLRRQVLPYVQFTERHPIVQQFTPEESEDRLYDLVSDYLRRDNLQRSPPASAR